MLTIGQKIRKVRELKGMKQETIAEMLHMSQANYSKIEAEEDLPYSRIMQIAQVLKSDITEILNIDKNPIFNGNNNAFSNSYNYHTSINEYKLIETALSSKDKTIVSLESQINMLHKHISTLEKK